MSLSIANAQANTSRSFGGWLGRHWAETVLVVYGTWVLLPFSAPVFMRLGWNGAGRAVYLIYSLFCHQLPERSFFFFGPKAMYSLAEIQAAWQDTANPMILRQFVGNAAMGWKIAWSDRMISFYMGVWLVALVWYIFFRKAKGLPWWGLVLFLLPMVVDGGSHAISDIAGIGQGFRDSNLWLAAVTNHALPAGFYAGDALGSFNSWMRMLTGLLAAAGIIAFAMPRLESTFGER